ncbi:hypothetical protein OGAPHI_004998 [Ogataea philodendri]|uniref:CENP-Q, a CENPA-CAD centromere complex subunit-domain-containing protein n=1 Tax=Ogataea philodendri TaxID=1378263 RepID=A0A9P8P2G9_9ASCO|nr:uncharacterized protein OGAPHI_004998 [Ogataea philodendri]KAH3663597.1 hypothetical protein OGAPHI_004998 [Ogataea philodendri]
MAPIRKTPKRPSALTRIKKLKGLDRPVFNKNDAKKSKAAKSKKTEERSLVKDSQTLFSDEETPEPEQPRKRKARAKKSQPLAPISDDSEQDSETEQEEPKSKQELNTYTQLISKKVIRNKWSSLQPNVSAYIDAILELYVEQSIAQITFRSNRERLAFRTLVKDSIVKPLSRKMRVARLPGGLRERLLDQERLDGENVRLEANLGANLRQLEVLRVEEQKELAFLKNEQQYYEDYQKAVQKQESLMEAQAETFVESFGDLQMPESSGYEDLNLADNDTQTYDPAADPDIQRSMSVLNKHLDSISNNVEQLEPLVEILDRVNSILQLVVG